MSMVQKMTNLYTFSLIYVCTDQIADDKMQYIDKALGVSGSIPVSQAAGILAVKGREEKMKEFLRHGIGQVSTLEFRGCGSMEEAAQWQKELHASRQYLTDLLRTKMGFNGVVVLDYSAVENVYRVQHVGESKGKV